MTKPIITAPRMTAAAMTGMYRPIVACENAVAAEGAVAFVTGELVGVELGSCVEAGVDVGAAVGA